MAPGTASAQALSTVGRVTSAASTDFDWDPRDESVVHDQVSAYDSLRDRCPVAHSEAQGWSLLRHADVLGALADPETFSSRVSAHVAIPNGMDGAEHATFRAIIDRCFTGERVASFGPALRQLADELVAGLHRAPRPADAPQSTEVMAALGEPYAALAQCSYLGWPPAVADALRRWSADSQEATRRRDRDELARVAAQFDRIIVDQLAAARAASPDASRTLTHELLDARIGDRPLTDDELVRIVRNWTAGELGTIAASVGIVVEFLARRPDLQAHLSEHPEQWQAAMDEMLRLQPPLIANRRRATRAVELGGRTIPDGSRVTILWPGVQRDPMVFDDPTEFRLDRDPADNLLYGRGPHYCSGEGLSRAELGAVLAALLDGLPRFRLAGEPVRARYPAGGFSEVRIRWDELGQD